MTAETRAEEEARVARLARHPFLRGVNRAHLALLADCALTSRFKAGQVIFREGEPADRFYLIEEGKVVLESGAGYGEPVIIETIGAGDLLGWSWMMPPYVWHFTARAVEPTEAIHFAGTLLRQYCEKDHSLGLELHQRMSVVMMKRLQAARKKMLSIQAHGEKLEPVVGLSPFMEQELDTYENEGALGYNLEQSPPIASVAVIDPCCGGSAVGALRQTCRSDAPVFCETIMFKISIYIVTLATLTSLLVAQSPPNTGVKQFPPQSTAIEDVLVPVPREIFHTLDKFAHSNWRAVQRPELAQWTPHGDQTEIALLLGVVIAEGFIAVEAEDAAEVKSVGRAVLTLARGLGVERAALRRSRSIVEHAEKGDWPAVRKEWDGVLPDVQQGMKELKSEQLAQLVSLGGWLRGTEALTALVLQNYSRDHAELLRQPALLDYFEKQLAGMSGDIRTKPIIVRMRKGIRKIRLLLASEDAQISQKKVKEIATVAEELRKSLSPKGRSG